MMSVYENFFIAGEGPPRDAARDIAAALNMTITVEDGGVYLWRFNADGPGGMGGEIFSNIFREPAPLPDEIDASDEYGIVFRMWATDRDTQEQKAENLFGELVATRPEVPMLLLHDMQMLVLSYLPERGIHRFPPMITPDIEFEAEWHGWVYNRSP